MTRISVPTRSHLQNNDLEDAEMTDIKDKVQVDKIVNYLSIQREEYPDDNNDNNNNNEQLLKDFDEQPVNVTINKQIYLVLDTNFIISHLSVIDELCNISSKYSNIYKIIIPTQVIKELDGLKSRGVNKNDEDISKLSRNAIDWIFTKMHDLDNTIQGQKHTQKLDMNQTKDDSILDCCLYFKLKNPSNLIILMSNDKNLCVKALTNGILTISFRIGMTAKVIADRIVIENENSEKGSSGGNLIENNGTITNDIEDVDDNDRMIIEDYNKLTLKEITNIIYTQVASLILKIIDDVLKSQLDSEDCRMLGYDSNKITTLRDCYLILIKFSESFFKDWLYDLTYNEDTDMKMIQFLKSRSAKELELQYVMKPTGYHELVEFYKFWVPILIGLYRNSEQTQLKDLVVIVEYWKDMLHSL
ncbi:hypothetical protein CANARDRAFT_20693 [[Candida] arabinofermentans NRRL YB-2248]|uniref:PIN domain-containing protein n=1 Tax=[Candida] arabinofermentans NRRL YB-2248 TaxID=983967 RepID=A0A1E4T876_9ASCO|nr:hypothetical protein CANARDRAFT_20693 [[Candida] arabinofermentans NRRL YB-2248]